MQAKVIRSLSVLMVVLFAAGCALHTRPLFDYNAAGEKVTVKRRAKRQHVDYALRWRSKAFEKNTGELRWLLSDDQKKTIEQYGQPDYIRHTFYSTRRDMVKEWVYWEKQKVFQFVRGTLVFEGPLTDLERVLIVYGYPTKSLSEELEKDINRTTFYYSSPFTVLHRVVAFSNDKMVYNQELE
jgi:hypothetical protein